MPSVDELLATAVSKVPGGSARAGQQEMAKAVAQAFRSGEHLLVQAGTGTGKSLAYLVPAIHAGKRAVISTATIALQSQLVEHDLPRLAKALKKEHGNEPTFALLKGRHHYACKAKLDGSEADTLFDDGGTQWLGEIGRLGSAVARVREWAQDSTTGDRAELDPGVDDAVWRHVSMSARDCVGATRCPFGDDCFAEAAKVKAHEADIIVTNHALVAIDLTQGRQVLPEHDLLVIDEAHELAGHVTSAARGEISSDVVARTSRRAGLGAELREQLSESADVLLAALENAPAGRLRPVPVQLVEALTMIGAASRSAHTALGTIAKDDPDVVTKNQTKQAVRDLIDTADRIAADGDYDVVWVEEDERLRRTLVVAPLSVAGLLGGGLFPDRAVVLTSATLTPGGRFDVMARSLGLPVDTQNPPMASAEVKRGTSTAPNQPKRTPGSNSAGDGTDTKNPSEGQTFEKDMRGAAAALRSQVARTSGSSAAAVNDGVAVDDSAESDASDNDFGSVARWRGLDVGSPFDYQRQGILYVAARLPRPTTSGLSEPAAHELVELATAAGGRTLGLFSSRKAASQAAEILRASTDLPVLLQGEDSLSNLVREFRADPKTCLLGVMSLWQGVDVPGPACQLVVIDRLPFPRPDEPLFAARAQAVDDAGGSGFMSVSVPHAAVRLAQGAGRLIRSTTDKGVVAVLDSRLHNSRYGSFVRRTLPPFWYTTSNEIATKALTRLNDAA